MVQIFSGSSGRQKFMLKRTLRLVVALSASGVCLRCRSARRRRRRERDAEAMKQKAAAIAAIGERPSTRTHRTTVTENEVNAYLAFDARDQLPIGVVDPSLTMLGAGRVSARAVVDLDAVRKSSPSTGFFDPRTFLRGHLPVTANGVLHANNGSGRLELESASVGGVPIPKVFLQEIVSYYSKSADNPAGISLDDAFALPSGIRDVQVERGQAVIVQ